MTLDAQTEDKTREARRRFLMSCGKFAVATPPAVTLLLAGAQQNYASASSGHGRGHHKKHGHHGRHRRHANNGFGNGGGDGVPGRSRHSDVDR